MMDLVFWMSWMGEDEQGAAAIEYGLIACLVSIAAITALGLAGQSVSDILVLVDNGLQFR